MFWGKGKIYSIRYIKYINEIILIHVLSKFCGYRNMKIICNITVLNIKKYSDKFL